MLKATCLLAGHECDRDLLKIRAWEDGGHGAAVGQFCADGVDVGVGTAEGLVVTLSRPRVRSSRRLLLTRSGEATQASFAMVASLDAVHRRWYPQRAVPTSQVSWLGCGLRMLRAARRCDDRGREDAAEALRD